MECMHHEASGSIHKTQSIATGIILSIVAIDLLIFLANINLPRHCFLARKKLFFVLSLNCGDGFYDMIAMSLCSIFCVWFTECDMIFFFHFERKFWTIKKFFGIANLPQKWIFGNQNKNWKSKFLFELKIFNKIFLFFVIEP